MNKFDEKLYANLEKLFKGTEYSLIKSETMIRFHKLGQKTYFYVLNRYNFNRKYLLVSINKPNTHFYRDVELNIIMKSVLCRNERIKRLLEEI